MKLAIFGSRTLYDDRVKNIILTEIEKFNPSEIVTSAIIEGVCKMARDICQKNAIPLKLHFINPKYAQGKYDHRSKAVLNDCDFVIIIHDGISKGTTNELNIAIKMNIPYEYYKLKKEVNTNVSQNIINQCKYVKDYEPRTIIL